MLDQAVYAVIIVAIALLAFTAYYWGANWVLDRSLATNAAMPHEQITRRDQRRSRIRPWIFLAPALIILVVYLIYPVFDTFRRSLMDSASQHWVGFDNYSATFGDPVFWRAMLNNVLWLLIVPAFSTALGLLIAVMADRVWWGTIAKALIFMPMAISFVGASVIWQFVYAYQGPNAQGEYPPQIGLLNAIVTAFGGDPQPWMQIEWVNSFLMMVILVWIQTGFAMVILSAALRGVPNETIEAARIDGANERQIFFSILIPQVAGTIVVVWTTITIVVLKVFDIVFAMGANNDDVQVLANFMYTWTFNRNDFGRGSAIAIILMLAVLPIMIWNIRRARAATQGSV